MAAREMSVGRETSPAGFEEIRRPESYMRPAVDIYETEENLTLMADLPGVDKERLDINLERGVLTIRGSLETIVGGDVRSREFALADYYRQFQIPAEIDADKTVADFKNGVLTLTMPKSESARPRRIEIHH